MCLCLLVFLLAIWSSQAFEIDVPPQNAVAVAGSSLQLTCDIDQEYNGYFEWRAYIGGKLGGQQIYRSPPFTSTSPRFHKFGDFGLEIDPVEWRDAGKYSCVFLTGDVRATASIVVIGQRKTCSLFTNLFEFHMQLIFPAVCIL